MASIGPVALRIFENASGSALVQVSYTITATHHDALHEQAYRELVQLIGVDIIGVDTRAGRGEDGTDDIIPGDPVWDGVVTFTNSQGAFDQSHEITLPSSSALDEDPGPIQRTDEIRASVTLTPVPPPVPTRQSNLVRRGAPVIDPG